MLQMILDMGILDLFWGIPFSCLSILAMIYFVDALCRIRDTRKAFKSHKTERKRISCYLKSGNMNAAAGLISSSNDPVIGASAAVLDASVKGELTDYSALRGAVKDVVNDILKVPYELFFDYFSAVILSIGFTGTLLSFFYTLINFNSDAGGFYQLFQFLAVGIRSSLFCASSAILMSTCHVWIKKKLEAEREMFINEDFYKNLICVISRPSGETGKTTK